MDLVRRDLLLPDHAVPAGVLLEEIRREHVAAPVSDALGKVDCHLHDDDPPPLLLDFSFLSHFFHYNIENFHF